MTMMENSGVTLLRLPNRHRDDFPAAQHAFPIGPLFKYTPREFAEAMVQRGVVRVGTLTDFQAVEKYGSAIGDEQEGFRSGKVRHRPGQATYVREFRNERTYLKDVLLVGGHVAIQQDERTSNYLIYCTTSKADREAMHEFECDTCVKIENVEAFFRALTDALVREGATASFADVQKCIYRRKEFDPIREAHVVDGPTRIPLWRHKDPRYAYQCEVRARWKPTGNLSPIIVEAPGIVGSCRIIGL